MMKQKNYVELPFPICSNSSHYDTEVRQNRTTVIFVFFYLFEILIPLRSQESRIDSSFKQFSNHQPQIEKIVNEENCSVFKLSTFRGGSCEESEDTEKILQKMAKIDRKSEEIIQKMADVDPGDPMIEIRKISKALDEAVYQKERKKAKDLVSEALIASDKSFSGFTRRNLENFFGNEENLLHIIKILNVAYKPTKSEFSTLTPGQMNPINRLDPYFRLESRDQKVKIGPFLTEIK